MIFGQDQVAPQSLRAYLQRLDGRRELELIEHAVDPMFELSAFLSVANAGPALLFNKVGTSPLRVVGNLLNSRQRIALALDCQPDDIAARLHAAIRQPVKPIPVETGPVREVVVTENPLAELAVPTFFLRENRPYISAGVIVARDPETGRANASFARFGVLDGRDTLVGIAPNHHLALFARKAAARGETLPIAVVLGSHPAIQLAACFYLGVGDDEMECAGALLGAAVSVVRTRHADLWVPAEAEIVIEGTIDATTPVPEGLISEYHGMYEDYGPGILARFSGLTRRKDAIFQVIEPGFHREHILLGAMPIAASLLTAVQHVVPNVREVAVTEAGAGRTDIVIQLDAPRAGQARRAMLAAWAAVNIVKRITVVDADIDPWDPIAVDWARLHRCRIERDLLLIPGAGADRSEALESGGLVTKYGIDATAKATDRAEGIERALPPKAMLDAARAWFDARGTVLTKPL